MIAHKEEGEWLALILNFERISFIGQPYKTFYLRNSRVFVISQSVYPQQAFLGFSSLLVRPGAFPRVEHLKGSSLTRRHQTWLERLARDKQCSLFKTLANYSRKKFYSIRPCANHMQLCFLFSKLERFLVVDTFRNQARSSNFWPSTLMVGS